MPDIKKHEIEKWVGTWRRASLSLKDVKKNELHSYDYYEKNRKILDGILQYACDKGKVRLFSGLVEQQRIFMKLRKTCKT